MAILANSSSECTHGDSLAVKLGVVERVERGEVAFSCVDDAALAAVIRALSAINQ